MMNILFRRVLSPIAIAALLILAIAGCGPHRSDPLSASVSGRSVPVEHVSLDTPSAPYAAMEGAIFQQINRFRQSKGLAALQLDAVVSRSARFHSREMASGAVPFGHDGFRARADTIALVLPFRSIGENVAMNMGYADPAGNAVSGWVNSPSHYENIVGDFTTTGIGIERNGEGEYYFTQIFVKEKAPSMALSRGA